MAGSTIAPD